MLSRAAPRGNMKLNPQTFASPLAQPLRGAYLISGDEPLLTGEAADAVRARAKETGFNEREVHFLERGSDWNDVRASAGNLSLFGSRRLVEIRLPSGKPGVAGGSTLVDLVERGDPDSVLMVLTPRLDRDAQNAAWVKAIETRGVWVQVWPVGLEKLLGWLRA